MKIRSIRARWLALAAGVFAVLAITTAVLAQPQPQYRFYGLPGDSTIDGELAPVGSTIIATADGEVLGSSNIGRAGTWYVDVEPESKNIKFTLNGISDPATYDALTVGGSRKVELHVTSSVPEGDLMQETPADTAAGEEDDMLMSENEAEDMTASDDADDAEMMGEADDEASDEASHDEEEDFPVTGSGGLVEEQGSSWPLAVGVTAALMAVIACAALLISRRTDSSVS